MREYAHPTWIPNYSCTTRKIAGLSVKHGVRRLMHHHGKQPNHLSATPFKRLRLCSHLMHRRVQLEGSFSFCLTPKSWSPVAKICNSAGMPARFRARYMIALPSGGLILSSDEWTSMIGGVSDGMCIPG